MKIRRRGWVALVLAIAGLIGCGGPPPVSNSSEEAQVTGAVRLKGKPATKGKVIFNPSNYKRAVPQRETTINADGTYAITTLVGQNMVSLSIPKSPIRGLEYEEITFDVQSGQNTLDIEFPQPEN